MRSVHTRIMALLVAFLMVISFTQVMAKTPTDITGKWELSGYTYNDRTKPPSDLPPNVEGWTLELNADGTGTMYNDYQSFPVKWEQRQTADGKEVVDITIESKDFSDDFMMFSINNGTLQQILGQDGMVFERHRQTKKQRIKYKPSIAASRKSFEGFWILMGAEAHSFKPYYSIVITPEEVMDKAYVGEPVLMIDSGRLYCGVTGYILENLHTCYTGNSIHVYNSVTDMTHAFFMVAPDILHLVDRNDLAEAVVIFHRYKGDNK